MLGNELLHLLQSFRSSDWWQSAFGSLRTADDANILFEAPKNASDRDGERPHDMIIDTLLLEPRHASDPNLSANEDRATTHSATLCTNRGNCKVNARRHGARVSRHPQNGMTSCNTPEPTVDSTKATGPHMHYARACMMPGSQRDR